MSKRSFPLKDLSRRRFQTALTILSLTTLTTTTFFLLFFGENIEFEVALLTGGRLTMWFSYTFAVILFIIALLTFLTGVLVMSFFVSLAMSERVRDVGVMKAIGCLTDLVWGYFVTELFIMVFISCVAGFVLGMVLNAVSINLLNAFGFAISQKPINIWIIPPAFLAFLILPHFFGSRVIGKALMIKPSQALSTNYSLGMPSKSTIPVPSKLGLTFKTAFRTLTRRRIATVQAIACLSLVFAMNTVALAGGTIANQTTQNYVERAIQKNVVLIGHPDVTSRYVGLLSLFSEERETKPINYSNPQFSISESLVSKFRLIDGVNKVDPRLILETQVHEIPYITIEPESKSYIVVGDSRSSESLVLGLEPENAVNDWLVLVGRGLNKTDMHSALVGDSLTMILLTSPEKQGIELLNNEFRITGVCQDPLNNGNVIYVPLKALRSISGQNEPNLLLLQIDPSELSHTVTRIREEIEGTGLDMVELDEVLQKHLSFLNTGWSLVALAPLFSLAAAVLCLSGYMTLLISTQRRDLVIMKAIGVKLQGITKIVLVQALIIVLVSGAVGLSAGLLISFFLLPEPVISVASIVTIFLSFFLALAFLAICSLYPTVRTVKKSVIKAISEL